MTRRGTVRKSLRRSALSAAVLGALAGAADAARPGEGIWPPVRATAGGAGETTGRGQPAEGGNQLAPPMRSAAGEAEELEGDAAAVASFEYFFSAMNQNLGEMLGEAPFQSFENMGARTVRVTAGTAWLAGNVRQQKRSAVALYRGWRVANRYQAVKVIIADVDDVDYIIVRDTPRGLEILVRE